MRERAARGGGFQFTSGPAPADRGQRPDQGPARLQHRRRCLRTWVPAEHDDSRAIGLMVRNAFGIHPHVFEQATQGVPGRLVDLHRRERGRVALGAAGGQRRGDRRRVRGLRDAHPHHGVCRQPARPQPRGRAARLPGHDLADRVADLPKSAVALVLCPEHAQMFAAAGLSKADVQNWLSSGPAAPSASSGEPGRRSSPRAGSGRPGPAPTTTTGRRGRTRSSTASSPGRRQSR